MSEALGAPVTAVATEQGEPLSGQQCTWASASLPVKTYSLALTRTSRLSKALIDAGQSATTLYIESKKLFGTSEARPGNR